MYTWGISNIHEHNQTVCRLDKSAQFCPEVSFSDWVWESPSGVRFPLFLAVFEGIQKKLATIAMLATKQIGSKKAFPKALHTSLSVQHTYFTLEVSEHELSSWERARMVTGVYKSTFPHSIKVQCLHKYICLRVCHMVRSPNRELTCQSEIAGRND